MKVIKSRHWWGSHIRFDFTEEIDRGVELLDRKVPGWERGINTERLALVSGSRCVLGQVARSQWGVQCASSRHSPFGVAMNKLRLSAADSYGFYLPSGVGRFEPLAWRQLTRQWKQRIEALRTERAAQQQEFALAR